MPITADGAWATWAVTSSTDTTIWVDWANSTSATANTVSMNVTDFQLRQPTPEERERREREAEERRRATAEAAEKARLILVENLNRQQRREFAADGHFHVETRDGQRRYRLCPGRLPIRVHGEDGRRWSYCIHPRDSFPVDDVALALKLLIEANEDEFLEIANATEIRA